MTQTLQERLRNHPSHQCSKVRDEAADRIDALERALREIADGYGPNHLSKYAKDTAMKALD